MKSLIDRQGALRAGLADIRQDFKLPEGFSPAVLAAAQRAAKRTPSEHVNRTDRPFVTLDPASSTDLDQAFAIERSGSDFILHYAIADVAWFVDDGDPLDREAWRRGTTQYLPDGKASLYPPILSERAASLLPDGPRPAVIFSVRIDRDGKTRLDGVERALIRNRAKLGYAEARPEDLPPGFAALTRRVMAAEDRRGAARVEPPEQEVEPGADGRYALRFRARLIAEDRNAALSLATNLAVAQALHAHGTGLFRVMAEPDQRAIARLRHTATAYALPWPNDAPLWQYERTLDPHEPRNAAFMLAIRRAGRGASYVPYQEGIIPWHAAMAATYAHATAPLRRLADRYVIRAMLAIANGRPVPTAVTEAFDKLPKIMARAGALGGRIERAVIDLAEAVILQGREGEAFAAVVTNTDRRGARIQLAKLPIVARIGADGLVPGDSLQVRLHDVNLPERSIRFEPIVKTEQATNAVEKSI